MRFTRCYFSELQYSTLLVWSDSVGGWVDTDGIDLCPWDFSVETIDMLLDHNRLHVNSSKRPAPIYDYINTWINKLPSLSDEDYVVIGKYGETIPYIPLFSTNAKILCVGLNYAEHVKEFNNDRPTEPVIFSKASSALNCQNGMIILPDSSARVDYEGELVVVIGDVCHNVDEDEAMEFVAGYCVGNDVSARDWQKDKPAGQWLLGKSFDTFAPIGPVFVTKDEVGDPNDLEIVTKLNEQVVQASSTKNFIFKIPQLIAYISKVMTLYPGDLIFTGTPSGVGDARNPPIYLQHGDKITVEIEKIGKLVNYVCDSSGQNCEWRKPTPQWQRIVVSDNEN